MIAFFVAILGVYPIFCSAFHVHPGQLPNSRKLHPCTRFAVSYPDTSSTKPLPPGRLTLPFLNIFFDDTTRLLNPKDMKLLERKEKFGPIFKTNFLFQPIVFVTDEASIQELAREEALKDLKASFPPHHHKLFGSNSLLVQSGPTHQRIRKLVMGSMTPTMISSYEPLVEKSIQSFFQATTSNEYLEMVPKMKTLFLSILLQIVLGTSDVSSLLRSDIEIWSRGLVAPPLTFLPWTLAGKAMRARRRIILQLNALMDNPTTKTGLLATLMQAGNADASLSREEILDNLFTLVFAGSDTTSSAAISIWMILSQRPKLQQELKIATSNQLEAFVRSILESFPPAPFQIRVTSQELQVGGYRIPDKWQVAYGYAAALHGSAVPSTLDPSLCPASSSLAFGQGPRKCPGRYLAIMELQVFTKVLLHQQWDLEPDQNLDQTYTPGYFPVDKFRVKLG